MKTKKIFCLILCAVIVALSLTACSSGTSMTEANITKTVDKAFSALAEFDTDALNKYVSSSTLSIIMSYAESHDQFKELGKAMFANLSYEITSIDTENATVTVSVKNKDLTEVANEFVTDLKSNYSTVQLLRKLNDEDFLNTSLSELCDDIANAPMSDKSTEVTLNVQKGKKNLVLSFDSDAENAVSGNAIEAIKSIYGV